MIEIQRGLLSQEIKIALFFLLAMLATSSIAFFKGFFKINIKESSKVGIIYFSVVFFIYLFDRFGISSAIFIFIKYFKIHIDPIPFAIYSNLFLDLFLLFLLVLFCVKENFKTTKQIFKIKSPNSCSVSYDIFIGIISWTIIYPIVSLASSLLSIFVLVVFKTEILPDQLAINFIKSAMPYPTYFILALIMIVILAPIIEEFIFRGVLQNYLKNYFNTAISIILTSSIFALFHFSLLQKLANVTILGSIFILGCFLGFLYEKQKSLISNIFLHASFNAITILNIIFFKGV
ncbi:MAG: CPBP family intramembrane glutamic endopeptidase [Parachlamydiales bacterium]|jgi:hypothetical protein